MSVTCVLWFGPIDRRDTSDTGGLNIDRDITGASLGVIHQYGIGTWQGEIWVRPNAADSIVVVEWDQGHGYRSD